MTKLSLSEHLARKTPELRAALIAIGEAADFITREYERDEEVKPWLDRMIRAQLTTARGGYVAGRLRDIRSRFQRAANAKQPKVKRAIEAIEAALSRRS